MSRSILASFALWPALAMAHAFGERYDLPLPLALWLVAAALTVALSFAVFAAALRRPASYCSLRFVRLHPLVLGALRAASLCVLLSLVAAGFFGTQDPFRNLAPAFVWIAWWIGFTYLCMVLGDLWALINPWNLLRTRGFLRLPAATGVWPALALLVAFAWIEVVWHDNAVPANVAWLALGYSLATWAGMVVFGADEWLRRCEVFTVYFGFVSRLAPLELGGDGAVRVRAPAGGLLDPDGVSPSEATFVIVMLAIVTFDGLRETPLWTVDDAHWAAAATAGLLATPCVFALAIYGVCVLMGRLSGASAGELARLFVPTLLPIALAYHVAHYLTYLLITGQVVIPLASDPLGRGWDLLGTARYQVSAGIVGARFAWYTSVIVIVAGHVLAMYAAHRLALARFSEPRAARRSQYPLAALMVGYTMLSLWILAQPIVVE
jgi:uncharacterized membrane protein